MNKRIKKKRAKAKVSFKPMSSKALLRKQLTALEKKIKAANSLKNPSKIKGKAGRTAQRKAAQAIKRETKRQYSAAMRTHYLQSIRTPEQYQGKLQERGDYYVAIKKYNEYLNKGLIRESSILDKYETADAFVTTLSKGEMDSLLAEGAIKERHIQQTLAKKAEELERFAKMINF